MAVLDPVVLRRGYTGRVLPGALGALSTAGFLWLSSWDAVPAGSKLYAWPGVLLSVAVVIGAATMSDRIVVVDNEYVTSFPDARLRPTSRTPTDAVVRVEFVRVGLGTAVQIVASENMSHSFSMGMMSARQIEGFAQSLAESGAPFPASLQSRLDRD